MDTVLRTLGLMIFVTLCFRVMGYRSLGDMEPLDFIIVVGIAEILGAPLADTDLKVSDAFIAIATLTLLQMGLSYLSLKNPTAKKILEGKPLPVIKEGKIIDSNLRKARFTYEDLMEELRIHGLSSVQDVELANLEPNGRFSIIKRKDSEPITPRYLGRSTSLTVIENGEIMADKMKQAGITPTFLTEVLADFDVTDLNQVEAAVVSPSGNIAVTKKSSN